MGKLRVMGRRGDTALAWGTDTAEGEEEQYCDDVATVRAKFDEIVAGQGFSAFETTTIGEPAKRVKEFNEEAKEIILVPPMAGGA